MPDEEDEGGPFSGGDETGAVGRVGDGGRAILPAGGTGVAADGGGAVAEAALPATDSHGQRA